MVDGITDYGISGSISANNTYNYAHNENLRHIKLVNMTTNPNYVDFGSYAFVNCYSMESIDYVANNIWSISAGNYWSGVLLQTINYYAPGGTNTGTLNGFTRLKYVKFYDDGKNSRNPFGSNNRALENVEIYEDFDNNGWNLSYTNNMASSVFVNIFNNLKDRTGDTAYTLTLGATNLAKLTPVEIAVATNKNWSLS